MSVETAVWGVLGLAWVFVSWLWQERWFILTLVGLWWLRSSILSVASALHEVASAISPLGEEAEDRLRTIRDAEDDLDLG